MDKLIKLDNIKSQWPLYITAFKLKDRRSFDDYVRIVGCEDDFYADVLHINGESAGLMWYWCNERFTYIEHFAVDNKYRNSGYGSEFIQSFAAAHETVFLEAEPPFETVDRRRIAFYERNGFQYCKYRFMHPGYIGGLSPYPLDLMAKGKVSTELCREFVKFVFDKIVPQPISRLYLSSHSLDEALGHSIGPDEQLLER